MYKDFHQALQEKDVLIKLDTYFPANISAIEDVSTLTLCKDTAPLKRDAEGY